jgi:hypothetical protein
VTSVEPERQEDAMCRRAASTPRLRLAGMDSA